VNFSTFSNAILVMQSVADLFRCSSPCLQSIPETRIPNDEEEQSLYAHHDPGGAGDRTKSVCKIWYSLENTPVLDSRGLTITVTVIEFGVERQESLLGTLLIPPHATVRLADTYASSLGLTDKEIEERVTFLVKTEA
jgi:hypothetical protein